MSRLPVPGSDGGTWGAILNDYLSQSHNSDGTLKIAAITVAGVEVIANKDQPNGYASLDGSGIVPTGRLASASTFTKGVIQLAGDLAGTADAPTVPGLAAKASDASVVHKTGSETVVGVKTFTASPVVPTPLNATEAASKSYVDSAVSAVSAPDAATSSKGLIQLSGDLAGTATSPTVPGLAAKANDSLVVHLSGSETISGVKTYSASPSLPTPANPSDAANKSYVDTAITGVAAPDATASTKGLLKLAGDLAGTAALPTVPGLTTKAAVGANGDITSLSGLTTPLSLSQGGTGNATGVARQATIFVAAANASSRSKSAADYVATGTSDDVTLNAAITALPAGGGTIQLSEGLFSVAAASLTLRSNLHLRGTGAETTTIQLANGANGRMISSSSILSNITFESIVFDGNGGNQTDGVSRDDRSLLFLNNITDFRVLNCTISNCRHGAALRMLGMTSVIIQGSRFLYNGVSTAAYACDHSYCGDSDYYRVVGNYYDTSYDTGTAQDGVRWSTVTGNIYKNNVLGVSISASGVRPSQYNTITGNVIEGTGSTTVLSYGIKVSKFGSAIAANMTEGAIVGNVIRNCDRAMWIEQMDRLQISSNVMADAAGTNQQLMIISTVGTSTDVSIDNNLFYNTTNRGISFSGGGTQNNTRVTNNRFITVTTPVAGTIPAGTIFRHNQGFVTENSGTATVASASTTIVVNHGLGVTPSAANIVVSPTNSLGTATKFWVNTITSTQFTINTDAAPGATTATFSWQATVL